MLSTTTILTEFGFSSAETTIYLLLQDKGELTVPNIQKATALSRANIYDALQKLTTKRLVEHRKDGRVAYYRSSHPQNLAALITEKERSTALQVREMNETIRELTGNYNTLLGKPGMRFYEGAAQMKEALFDSLQAKDTIYTFANSQTINAFAEELNAEYMKQRIAKKIHKYIIFTDTPESRELAKQINPEYTTCKFLDAEKYPFVTPVEIYNDTVAFYVLHTNTPVAAMIHHEHIAQMHKSLFLALWDTLKSV
jgi:sugar-specific transcriptional regulator TrmB